MSESREEKPTDEYRDLNGKRQRLWAVVVYIDGHPVRGGTEWRDVPSSDEIQI